MARRCVDDATLNGHKSAESSAFNLVTCLLLWERLDATGNAFAQQVDHALDRAAAWYAARVDACYQKYRASMPEGAVVDPEPLIRAKWVRENYYTLLRDIVHIFAPEVPIAQVPEEKRK